jgi:CRISPR-associated endonuclease/helicase Cas3
MSSACRPEILQFWAKTDRSENRARQEHEFHPLAYHLLDVAACADAILDANPSRLRFLADLCEIETEKLRRTLVCLVALHDVGKCARGFQGKVAGLWPSALGPKPEPGKFIPVRHDAAGLWLFMNEPRLRALGERLISGLLPSEREKIIQSVVGHHGEPLELDFRGDVAAIANSEVQIGHVARLAATELGETIYALFDSPGISPPEKAVPTLSFALAGLAVLSDWLGSNCYWFEFATPSGSELLFDELMRYWRDVAGPVAKRAVRQAGLIPARASPFRGVKSLFPHIDKPTPLQLFCEEVALPDGPILFVIEDMTGAGKTEAAVALAHRLLANGRARGVHVALPTMATANAMFGRLSASYRRLFAPGTDPSVVLVHGRRDLCEGFQSLPRKLAYDDHCDEESDDPSEITASAFCADWIARSNKQAFLAQMGAGTVDQALLAILPARHQALRLWGLVDKALVIDEAHAYDAYMNKELETLLGFHAALGGSVIVLSATLPALKRHALIDAFRKGLGSEERWSSCKSAYPLVTIAAERSAEEYPISLRDSLAREVALRRIGDLTEAHAAVLEAACKGAAVALIRNTVDEAVASYAELASAFDGETLLFHARFAMTDRLAIEERVLEKFGRAPKIARPGILVATQVIEQSLDLDFDLIVTDLAPIDLLIQRAGRLWRHMDQRPEGARPHISEPRGPTLLILSAEPVADAGARWLDSVLPKTTAIYRDAALLWRSAKVMFDAGKIVGRTSPECAAPGSGELRALVEAAYGENRIAIPGGLEGAQNEAAGKASAERSQGGFNVLRFEAGYDFDGGRWDADSRVPTRIGDDTITLRLAVLQEGRILPWALREGSERADRRAWALSEVSVRWVRCKGTPKVDRQTAVMIEKAREGWTLSEQEMPILVLKLGADGRWSGAVIDRKEKEVMVTYSADRGLSFVG